MAEKKGRRVRVYVNVLKGPAACSADRNTVIVEGTTTLGPEAFEARLQCFMQTLDQQIGTMSLNNVMGDNGRRIMRMTNALDEGV